MSTLLVRSSFVIKDYQAENSNMLVKLEQGNLDVSDYTRKFNDYHSFWKAEISETFTSYLFIMGLRFEPLRADLISAYSLGKFNCLFGLQLHVDRSNLCCLPATSRGDTHRQIQQPINRSQKLWF